jgi:hypothetical protein
MALTETIFGFEGYACLFRLPGVLYTTLWMCARIGRTQVISPKRR